MEKRKIRLLKLFLVTLLALSLTAGCSRQNGSAGETDTVITLSDAGDPYDSGSDRYDTSYFTLVLRNKSDMKKKEGVYYEIFVRSFADSNGDGIGDFNGITANLGYLEDLGIDGIWLMPVNESPSYHGYDTTDYSLLNDDYGTEEDFQTLIDEAHKHKIKIIMDFVINHTSDRHPWFISSASDINSEYRDYYRWVNKDDAADYSAGDVSPWNAEVWHSSGDYFYYGIFWSGMPDLNYNNPKVRGSIKEAAGKWLNMGIDGFRLDAAMHIYGDNEFKQMGDTTGANIQWWNEFAVYCESINPAVYLVGEAWQDDEILAEYAQPFDTKFDFAFELDMMACLANESAAVSDNHLLSFRLQEILDSYAEADPNYLDGIFASNHDQNRVMSQLNDVEKAKLAASIYLTLPGNPFIYYGEEIGMYGAKPDENIREPFKWTSDGSGMDTAWETASSNYDTTALEDQINDSNSIYNHYREMIALRKAHNALTEGTYTALDAGNSLIMAYTRTSSDETLYIFHNFSSSENVTVNMPETAGSTVIYQSSGGNMLDGSEITLAADSSMILQTANV